jgi:formate hydrogenlyase transcriptional activator
MLYSNLNCLGPCNPQDMMDQAMPNESKGRLLVVDVEPDSRQTLVSLLSLEGYETRCAPDGTTALMFAEANPPELILLDARLPDLDGHEVCRRLKAAEKTKHIPVIFLGGLDGVVDKVSGFESGGVDYITKPFQACEVLARVETHLELHRLRQRIEDSSVALDAMVQERTRELIGITESLVREITEREKVGEALEERFRFERLLTEISARFVNVPPDRLDGEIENALKMILEFLQVDRCGLLQILPGKASWLITHAAYSERVPPVPEGVELPSSINPWAYDKLTRKREVVSFSNLEDVPAEADVDKKTWIEWGIRSNLVIPIITGESVSHLIAINVVKNERVWTEEFIKRLRLLGEIIMSALQRRTAEQALHESEERLSLAVSSAEAGLWVLDVNTGLAWVTDKLRELFQFGPDEQLSLGRFMDAIHPDDRENVRESVRRSLEKGEPLNVEYRIVHPGGAIRWIAARGRPYSRVTELPDRLMGVSIDITERKKMESTLKAQLEEIERLKLQLEDENIILREELRREQGFEKIIGSSDALNYVLFRIGQVAPTDATVLILGETGTGKGMVANAIHDLSRRSDRPMITVNCAALPANLVESELFGREKGAFTGAHARQAGRFEAADSGTIFLDEIGELPLELQSKLLRVLQDSEFERLGSAKTVRVDVRVIASTSRDLREEVREGQFREDLFYRLNVFPVSLPPLRKRTDDIPELVRFFVDKYARKFDRRIETIPKSAVKTLEGYPWPGNVRELEHVIERAVITTSGPVLQLADHLEPLRDTRDAESSLKDLAAMEREHILRVLQETGWKIEGPKGAAAILNLHPSTLRFRIKKLGIRRP